MTFMPEEGFSDPVLAPLPAPGSAPELQPPPVWRAPPVPAEFINPPPRAARSRRRVWIGAGLGVVVALLVIGGGIALTNRPSPPLNSVYTGAPVEASDASDGATVVGLGDTIAYVPEAHWRDATETVEFEGATGPAAAADDVVGFHAFDAPDGRLIFVGVLGHRGSPLDDPTERFAAVLAEVYEIDVAELSGSVHPVSTALGLDGAVGVFDRPIGDENLSTRFAILGRGGNSAIVEWVTIGAPADEAAFQRLIDTVRVDS